MPATRRKPAAAAPKAKAAATANASAGADAGADARLDDASADASTDNILASFISIDGESAFVMQVTSEEYLQELIAGAIRGGQDYQVIRHS